MLIHPPTKFCKNSRFCKHASPPIYCKFFAWIDWDFYDQKIVDFWGWFTIKLSDGVGYSDYNWLDQKIVDGFGHIIDKFGKTLKVTQTGIIQNYLLGGVIGIVAVFIVFKSF